MKAPRERHPQHNNEEEISAAKVELLDLIRTLFSTRKKVGRLLAQNLTSTNILIFAKRIAHKVQIIISIETENQKHEFSPEKSYGLITNLSEDAQDAISAYVDSQIEKVQANMSDCLEVGNGSLRVVGFEEDKNRA